MRASAGRTNRWKVTIADTGLPGSPKTRRAVGRGVPNQVGLPGPQRDAPEDLLDAELGERRLHVVVRPDRDPAGHDDDVGVERALERLDGCRGSRRRPCATLLDARARLHAPGPGPRSRSCCGSGPGPAAGRARPARRPSRRTATRGRRAHEQLGDADATPATPSSAGPRRGARPPAPSRRRGCPRRPA